MGKKDKKKGKGAEKTAAKTDKKLTAKLKKQLAIRGEDDIEKILAEIAKEDQKKLQVVEKVITPPTRRAFATLTPHPYKDELILFGGEFHNGHETFVYNDLFVYKISTDQWTMIKAPGAPPPRTSHQTVAVPSNKGELWVFGGEFTTKGETQFYHYRDLWQYQLDSKQWTKLLVTGGPSARSGHRMVLYKHQLIVFGGYHDNLKECKYYNDVYSFDLANRTWTKLEPSGNAPAPRSGCQMAVSPENKIVVWGGYSKTKVKKDVDTGVTHSDMYLLSPEKNDATGLKWKWSVIKPGGMKYGARSGVSATYLSGKAYTFGGSVDHETEEDMTAEFFNELHSLDLQKLMWTQVILTGKKDGTKQKRRRKLKEGDTEEGSEEEMEVDEEVEEKVEETVVDDGVFTMRIGPAPTQSSSTPGLGQSKYLPEHPHPRINCTMAVKNSKLYLYGGIYEDEDKEYTLCDFHCLDLHKMDEWKVLIPCDLESQEWIESADESDEETGSDEESGSNDSEEEMED